MILSRTPYRLSLLGGGSDMPGWYNKHSGAQVLATSISHYCMIATRCLPPFFDKRHHIVWSKNETVDTIDEIEHPVVRAVLKDMGIQCGIELTHLGDLPARSGVGSSSAFVVGLVHALRALCGKMTTKDMLATEAIRVERDLLKENVGDQDQVITAKGGFYHVEFGANGCALSPIVASSQKDKLEKCLMLFFTKLPRISSEVQASIDIDGNTRQLRILSQLVDDGLSILSGSGDIRDFGALLHESWEAKRALNPAATTWQIDQWYDTARSAGALGGKVTGAGGGGFLLLFVEPDKQELVKAALPDLVHVPFKFETQGSTIVMYEPEM